ncbi:MAG: hypothetical protein KAR40_15450 [Candidatus Sabulitectum sp.]|nr:hypothetical protein [Candidatus Sabulitectum sp.]
MNAELYEAYKKARGLYFPTSYPQNTGCATIAVNAIQQARYQLEAKATLARFEGLGGYVSAEWENPNAPELNTFEHGLLRVLVVDDEHGHELVMDGDCFNPEVNDDINLNILKREEKALIARIDNVGCCGLRAEFWNGLEWVETDSRYGFVGDDYEHGLPELYQTAMDGLEAHQEQEARAFEALRPDMYKGVEL